MHQTIYILKDGQNSKIGQTQDWDKRASAYNTHNPNYTLHKKYECTPEQAQYIEKKIKHLFKEERAGQGQEWFKVDSKVIESIVDGMLSLNPLSSEVQVSHHVPLTSGADDLYWELRNECTEKNNATDKALKIKDKLAVHFTKALNLGVPEHMIPKNCIYKEELTVDPIYCNRGSALYSKTFESNRIQIFNEDHPWHFYEVFKLSTGHHICLATAMVTMPYGYITDETEKQRHLETAYDLGFNVSFRNEWSWHYPKWTGLALYQMKTSRSLFRSLFESSLRKWVLVNSENIKQLPGCPQQSLRNAVRDITLDITFPLDIETVDDLREHYGSCNYEDAYKIILKAWSKSKHNY